MQIPLHLKLTLKSFLEKTMHQEIFVDHLHVPRTDLGADNIVMS